MEKKGGGGWGVYDDETDITMDLTGDIEKAILPKVLTKCKLYTSRPCNGRRGGRSKSKSKKKNKSRSKSRSKSKSKKKNKSRSKSRNKSKSKRSKSKRSKAKSKSKNKRSISKSNCTEVWSTPENKDCQEKQRLYVVKHPQEVYKYLKKYINKNFKNYDELDRHEQGRCDVLTIGIAIYLARGWGGVYIGHQTKLPSKLPQSFPIGLKKMALFAARRSLTNFDNQWEWKNPQKRVAALQEQIALFK